jgi:hypothetical protein
MSWKPSSGPAIRPKGDRRPDGWSGSEINRTSRSFHRRTRPSSSNKAEGSEAFWTQAKPEPGGTARHAGRANQTFEPIKPPWQAIREWLPDDDAEPGGEPVEIPRKEGCTLDLDSE